MVQLLGLTLDLGGCMLSVGVGITLECNDTCGECVD
jgi:hypothetical protein